MKYNYLTLAMVAVALFSCTGYEVDNPETDGALITIRAFQEGSATRTTVIDGGAQVYWEPSDELKVFFRGTGSRFLSQNTENAEIAEFSGSLNVMVGVNEGASGSNTLWGLYPYRADATSDGESVTTTLPAEQTGRAGSFAKGTFITLAKSNSFDLAFYNVCGGIRFSLTQEGVKKVVFQSQNDEAIAGKVKIAFADGVPAIQQVLEGQKTITLTAPNGGTFETGKWYYIVALPGALSNGFKMTFDTANQTATLKSSGSKTIKRGVFGSLADADEDLVYKDKEGGDEPNPDDVIQFEDPIAKYACVEKFDTNGDGEVSYAEAAAVTSLEGLFTEFISVTSFDEIQYFTGVTSISGVFTGCSKLTHVTIPDWISSIGSNTFQNCSALESVVLPATLSSLPAYCFDGCSALVNVTLPSSIISIPDYCFQNCVSLTTVSVPPTLTSLGRNAFSRCTNLTGMDFPAEFTTIGDYAFLGCQAITEILIPDSVTYIGKRAFSGCSSLASIVLPDNLTGIPPYCFSGCSALSAIAWPVALTSIGDGAFGGCDFMDIDYTIELPSTVTSIGEKAFDGIHHLVIPSTSPVSIAANSFSTYFTFLYVPSNMVEMYKVRTNWSNYAYCIRPIDDYPAELTAGGAIGEAVDLGLSVKWASWNIGASAPEESGGYFAWGETDIKWVYDWANYKWCEGGSYNSLTKYNPNSDFGIVDNKNNLDLEDDAAHIQWGGTWRIPTDAEWEELWKNCSYEMISINGKGGQKLTGPSGNSIFLPISGYREGARITYEREWYYWSSSLYSDYHISLDSRYYPDSPHDAICMWSQVFGGMFGCVYRYYGLLIRPVCE